MSAFKLYQIPGYSSELRDFYFRHTELILYMMKFAGANNYTASWLRGLYLLVTMVTVLGDEMGVQV